MLLLLLQTIGTPSLQPAVGPGFSVELDGEPATVELD